MNELTHYAIANPNNDYLAHHGVKGQKWGVRKKQQVSNVTKSKKGLSKGAKVALGVGAGILGAAAVGTVGAKYGPGAVKALGTTAKAIKSSKASKEASKAVKDAYFNKNAKKSAKVFKDVARKEKKQIRKEATKKAVKATKEYTKDFGKRTLQAVKEQGAQRAAGVIVGVAAVPIANLGARAQRAGNEWINERLGR